MRVLFTRRAEQQVQSLHSYIAALSGEMRADAYINRIVAFCRALETFPHRGMQRDDLLRGLRLVGFKRRLTIAFTISDEAVVIQGIFYGGRDLATWREE